MENNNPRYSPAKLKKFKNIITDKLENTTNELAGLKADLKSQKQKVANTNTDFNENSKHFQEQAKDKRLIRRFQDKARALNAALNRIENGTYGVCTRTNQLIREERLLAMPTAQFDVIKK
ncbi:MAG: TraR/DksA family transcriptional regulator [Saprospiraceae bacterium]